MNALCGSSHRLQETVLIVHMVPALHHIAGEAGRMDVSLTGRRSHTDALILQYAAETSHEVSLEVCQIDDEVVVLQVRSYDVILDMLLVAHRNLEVALLIHDVHVGNVIEAMLADGVLVRLGSVAAAFIRRIALDDSAVHQFHQLSDELRFQIVMTSQLARADLHANTSGGWLTQFLVDLNQ